MLLKKHHKIKKHSQEETKRACPTASLPYEGAEGTHDSTQKPAAPTLNTNTLHSLPCRNAPACSWWCPSERPPSVPLCGLRPPCLGGLETWQESFCAAAGVYTHTGIYVIHTHAHTALYIDTHVGVESMFKYSYIYTHSPPRMRSFHKIWLHRTPRSYLRRSKSNTDDTLAEVERNLGDKHSTRCPWRPLCRPPQPKHPLAACLSCALQRGAEPSCCCTLKFSPLLLSFCTDTRLPNALVGCSLIHICIFPPWL